MKLVGKVVGCSTKMSYPTSPVSLSKRLIKVESRARTGSDPIVYSLKKSNLAKVRSFIDYQEVFR